MKLLTILLQVLHHMIQTPQTLHFGRTGFGLVDTGQGQGHLILPGQMTLAGTTPTLLLGNQETERDVWTFIISSLGNGMMWFAAMPSHLFARQVRNWNVSSLKLYGKFQTQTMFHENTGNVFFNSLAFFVNAMHINAINWINRMPSS